jgi:hypothetical protein
MRGKTMAHKSGRSDYKSKPGHMKPTTKQGRKKPKGSTKPKRY